MGCKAGRCNKTSTPKGIFINIPSLEAWPTMARSAFSPWGKTKPPGHQPSISMSYGQKYSGHVCSMEEKICSSK